MLADQRLHALAARQHGCVTVDQARAAGLSVSQIHRRLRDERFERLGHHVLRVAGSPHSWEQQLMAVLLDHGDGAVVSHHAAAALHAFDGFPRQPVEVTMTRAARGRRAHWQLHTTRRLELIDRTEIDGFRTTTASRTIIDLAATASVSQLERAIDSAVRDGWSSPAFLRRRLGALRGRGRRGVRLLDELLEDSGGHSDLERRFLALVRRAGLPKPTCQRILGRGETVARVDFSFEPRPVLVEVSGRRGHASDAERAKDARRRNELQELGFVVLEFTNRQVREQPGYVIATLRRHLA
jgi:very-short-patch-repair endonuclease/predicted transcriptional regulator of viral defense system